MKRNEISVAAIATNEPRIDSGIEDLKNQNKSVESFFKNDRDKKDSASVNQLSSIVADLMNQIKVLKSMLCS